MEVFKHDLDVAGIPYRDSQCRQADFHALRHTLRMTLERLGVAPRVAMEVMRHSDMRLTNRTYTDAKNRPALAVVEMLPRFSAQSGQQVGATGTDGAVQTPCPLAVPVAQAESNFHAPCRGVPFGRV